MSGLKILWYVVVGMFLFLGPHFNYSLQGMVAHMRAKALLKAGEPWPEPCFDWSNTRMPIEEQRQWKKEYVVCKQRNKAKHDSYWKNKPGTKLSKGFFE